VRAITVRERGVSGRAKSLSLRGNKGTHDIQGELAIRRFFGMLNSSMFLVSAERDKKGEAVAWQFEGGGWGHGVGLCQMGAIGRAEAGQSHEDILRHYFNGATVQPLYEK
jgi:SpoIID/LytB domain protein